MNLTIFKAQPIGDESIEDVTITIQEVAWSSPDLASAARFYQRQGDALVDALWACLPGGTIDQMIAELLRRRASLFRVRFDQSTSASFTSL